ncbi:hypothetical protein Clacol_007824 [Clathrus columnatus]|uniref:Uncharacterized protein n=1 Tax=Clathrus columnatus TaxID=1419009 RepID=A0AAV5ALJ2_9AGAM|nr:hypothetical protein Clacol_007824 [Clathrus columnatus]
MFLFTTEADAVIGIINQAATVLSDVLAFLGVIYQTWGLWRLKRSVGLQNNEDLVTTLIRQDLRWRNTKTSVSSQSALELPTLSFSDNPTQSIRTILGRLHESIMDDMGERNHPVDSDGPGSGEPDDSHGMNLGAATD